jgi:hypothetical protein
MTKVVAVERGHDGRVVHEVGETFDLDLEDPRFKGSTWFVPVDKAPAAKTVDPNARPPGAGPKPGSAKKSNASGVDDIA